MMILIFIPSIPQIPTIPPTPEINQQINQQEVERSFLATYSDSDCSKQEVNFFPNQTVYIRAEVPANQGLEATLSILNSQKNEIWRQDLFPQADNYYAEYEAPGEAGVYYLHFEIKGKGLSYSGERNFNVYGNNEHAAFDAQVETESSSYGISDSKISESTEDFQKSEETEAGSDSNLLNILSLFNNWIVKFFKLFWKVIAGQ